MRFFVLTILLFTIAVGSITGQSSKNSRKRQSKPVRSVKLETSCYHPSVTDLVLTEIDGDLGDFSVQATVENKNDSIIKYVYFVTVGKIVGEGQNVRWKIGDALPGTYTITAGVDDGCGVCGQTQTLSITVK